MKKFSWEMTEKLKSYVYAYIDPSNDEVFYAGKGKDNRAFSHMADTSETRKVKRIEKIRGRGRPPRIEILRYGLTDDQATLVEATVIDTLGLINLTNEKRGQHSQSFGRVWTEELRRTMEARPARFSRKHKAILIVVNKLYRSGMSDQELLEATCGIWKVEKRREKAKIAMAVYQGIIHEVYHIEKWHKAGTHIKYTTRDPSGFRRSRRWEFEGRRAGGLYRGYVGKSVRRRLGKRNQNPIRYVNIPR
jgi:uncharacterized protein